MNEYANQSDNDTEPTLPQSLRDDLAAMTQRRLFVPEQVDRAVLAEAERRLAPLRPGQRGGWRGIRPWLGGAAAAAAVAAAVLLAVWGPLELSHRQVASGQADPADLDRSGSVDILDAFALARAVDAGRPTPALWDFNADGMVDRRDADTLAQRAVQLDGGAG